MSEVKEDLRLIGPAEFKKKYAPTIGITSVRDLFHIEGFPCVKIGTRYYTTEKAAMQFLEQLGMKDV